MSKPKNPAAGATANGAGRLSSQQVDTSSKHNTKGSSQQRVLPSNSSPKALAIAFEACWPKLDCPGGGCFYYRGQTFMPVSDRRVRYRVRQFLSQTRNEAGQRFHVTTDLVQGIIEELRGIAATWPNIPENCKPNTPEGQNE